MHSLKRKHTDDINITEVIIVPPSASVANYLLESTAESVTPRLSYASSDNAKLETLLTDSEESTLVDWVLSMVRSGFPVTCEQLIASVQTMLSETDQHILRNAKNSRTWYTNFLERNPIIAAQMKMNVENATTKVTQSTMVKWSIEIENCLRKQKQLNLLNDPKRIFIIDEFAFLLQPSEIALARKGAMPLASVAINFISNLFGLNAAGMFSPSVFLLPSQKKSEVPWASADAFLSYLKTEFLPWLLKTRIHLPVVIFLNMNSNFLTIDLSNFCKEHFIILLSLYPNSTQFPKPMDVELFDALHTNYKSALGRYCTISDEGLESPIQSVSSDGCATTFAYVVDKPQIREAVRRSFKCCGIYPFISYSAKTLNSNRNVKKKSHVLRLQHNIHQIKTALKVLETYMGDEMVRNFKLSNAEWFGLKEDVSLYRYWKELDDFREDKKVVVDLTEEEKQDNTHEVMLGEESLNSGSGMLDQTGEIQDSDTISYPIDDDEDLNELYYEYEELHNEQTIKNENELYIEDNLSETENDDDVVILS